MQAWVRGGVGRWVDLGGGALAWVGSVHQKPSQGGSIKAIS